MACEVAGPPSLAVLAVLPALVLPAVAFSQEIADPAPAPATSPMPIGAVVNGQALADPGLIVQRDGRILARVADLESWGLAHRLPASLPASETIEGDAYVPLDAVPGLRAQMSSDGAALELTADPALFPHLSINTAQASMRPRRSAVVPAQFVDYDLTASRWNAVSRLSGFVDVGLSGAWGVLDSTTLIDTLSSGTGKSTGITRLDTAYRRDFPDHRLRLILGDTVGRGAPWSRQLRYGGLFIGTDFSLDPQTITFPLPTVSGSAVTPSTVELVSDAARRAYDVGPGTFDVTLQPRITGSGQVTMTVRDLAGNARQVTRSFYTSTALLRPGLAEFAFEAGALRQGYGLSSFGYGPLFAAFGLRRGMARNLTVEGRIEAGDGTVMAGAGGTLVLGAIGEVAGAAAFSQSAAGTGTLVRAQAQRVTPVYSLTLSYEQADAAFRQVGESRRTAAPGAGGRSEMVAAGSLSLGRIGSLNASYARLKQGIGGTAATAFSLASASWASSFRGDFASVGLQYTSIDGAPKGDIGVFASLTMALGPRSHATLSAEQGRVAAIYDRGLPSGTGWGYRALAGREEAERGQAGRRQGAPWLEGSLSYRSAAGDLRIDAVQRSGQSGMQVNARGALLRVGETLLATPRIDYGFALVEVASDSAVTVTVENRPAARKAGQGRRVIVTALQPYTENRVGIDAADLPIDTNLAAEQQRVVPGWRQATRVRFGGEEGKATSGALLRLVDAHGDPLPIGSTARWSGGSGVVGHDGEVWIEDYTGSQGGGSGVLRVDGPGGSCIAAVPEVSPPDRLAPKGTVACTPFIIAEAVL